MAHSFRVVTFAGTDRNYVMKHNGNYKQFETLLWRLLAEGERTVARGRPLGYAPLDSVGKIPFDHSGPFRTMVTRINLNGPNNVPFEPLDMLMNEKWDDPPETDDNGIAGYFNYGEYLQYRPGQKGYSYCPLSASVPEDYTYGGHQAGGPLVEQQYFNPYVVVRKDWGNETSSYCRAVGHDSYPILDAEGYILDQFLNWPDLTKYQLRSERGQPNGYCDLDANGKVPMARLDVDAIQTWLVTNGWLEA